MQSTILLLGMLPVAIAVTAIILTMTSTVQASDGLSWKIAEDIRKRIHEPVFPGYSVTILEFGAEPDNGKICTAAIQDAIKHVNAKGGGTVIVPKGAFLTGALRLLSNVNLCLEDEGSLLLYTTETTEEHYPIVYSHWEASPLYNYSALIYAKDEENIALTGKGTLDAQSNFENVWWHWRNPAPDPISGNIVEPQDKGVKLSREMNNNGVPVSERIFGDGWNLRPNFIQPINCKNVLLEGVTLRNSPMWQVNPVLCENVIIRGMTLSAHGHNTDCVDPESCNLVLIENNVFDSGDDCVAIKSGRDRDGRELNTPCRNILVLNNRMADGHGGVAIGSEMSGGVCNVFADGNHFDSPNLTYPLRFKTNARRGGVIENVYLRNSNIARIDQAVIHGTMLYSEGDNGSCLPVFRNIIVENVTSNSGQYGIFLEAFKESPITGLVLRNLSINGVRYPLRAMNWAPDVVMENVVINGIEYPAPTEVRIIGVPAQGETLIASALLIGGNDSTLSFRWEAADTPTGIYTSFATGRTCHTPNAAHGSFIRLVATDENGRTAASIPYRILKDKTAGGLPVGEKLSFQAARLASRGIIDEDVSITPSDEVTRIEIARALAKMWNLGKPEKKYAFTDMDANSADYAAASAVVENGMMALDKMVNVNLTNINIDEGAGSLPFRPNDTVTREEMGTIVMMSCGVSYKNAANTFDSTYRDGDEISTINLTDIERGTTLGFWDNTGYFFPKINMTHAMLLDSLNRIADFAGK